ncbi:hypothetical protein K458DRAFT_439054 [Lentithecium fluviatile CBS 122367]|uniref:Uncharacterized protein n=1 Tax=Lentithecium fluviatile CBS 122367 TaxID=1168545 RepID=A0A6G1JH90_9PLEO|nr:hypothetical protein K458DRAFT_439054 [Lentithecium fluviatile CBS 122367]
MAAHNALNIWSTMQYVPPRGQCNFKQSIMSAKCPCLRFMLHPLKSSSSYECDGCTHHASFHSMENKEEDAIRKRWEQAAKERQAREEELAARPKKRLREIEYNAGAVGAAQVRALESGMLTPEGDAASEAGSGRAKTAKGKGRKAGVGRATRTKEKNWEVDMDDDEYIERV